MRDARSLRVGWVAEVGVAREVGVGDEQVEERAAPDRSQGFDDGRVPVDGPERRLGFVFDAALDELGGVFADESGGEVEAAVDAGWTLGLLGAALAKSC